MKNQLSHRVLCHEMAETTKTRICRALCLKPEEYDMLHYELAHEWLQERGFPERTARVYILSKIFHNWFRQQAMFVELTLVNRHPDQPLCEMQEFHRFSITTMPVKPSHGIRIEITEEGLQAIRRNRELLKIKVYENSKSYDQAR